MDKKSFWKDLGSTLAKGTKVCGESFVIGSVFVVQGTKNAALHTGKAFKEEWKKQAEEKRNAE
jgi:hypothetical protein